MFLNKIYVIKSQTFINMFWKLFLNHKFSNLQTIYLNCSYKQSHPTRWLINLCFFSLHRRKFRCCSGSGPVNTFSQCSGPHAHLWSHRRIWSRIGKKTSVSDQSFKIEHKSNYFLSVQYSISRYDLLDIPKHWHNIFRGSFWLVCNKNKEKSLHPEIADIHFEITK